jgi:hypothetical protein
VSRTCVCTQFRELLTATVASCSMTLLAAIVLIRCLPAQNHVFHYQRLPFSLLLVPFSRIFLRRRQPRPKDPLVTTAWARHHQRLACLPDASTASLEIRGCSDLNGEIWELICRPISNELAVNMLQREQVSDYYV